MIKKIKNINLLILWFAGLIMFAHSVIPHDHHFDFNHKKHHEESNSQKEPIHCFSFNDIISDNTTQKTYKVTNENILSSFYSNDNKFSFQDFENSWKILFPNKNKFDCKIVFIENIPVRGSPFVI